MSYLCQVKPNKSIIAFMLVLGTLAVYWQIIHHEFITYDDDVYVVQNSFIQNGITTTSINWAFTSFYEANWHPLTWLSHMFDFQLFGLDPRGHHLINLLLHTANTLLLFHIFTRMTTSVWRSAFVAALFALHPAHVESVAWVAERKDLLSTLFWFLAMLAYVRYVEKPSTINRISVLLAFACGLMSKPMVVTLPCVLLLLDYWPLDRLKGNSALSCRQLILEKMPLIPFSIVSCAITIIAQSKDHAIIQMNALPLSTRLANACVAYASYFGKMFWPQKLAVLYPFPSMIPTSQILAAATLLAFVTAGILVLRQRAPYMPVGWFWFLGTLIPVIGLVQVGQQALADRYTYIPFIGLFIMVAWGIPDMLYKWRQRQHILAAFGLTVTAFLAVITWRQTAYWRNSAALFEHTLQVTNSNCVIHVNLANVLAATGRNYDAIAHYREALQIRPVYPEAHYNLANTLFAQKLASEAVIHYQEALRQKPDYGYAYNNLGVVLQSMGKTAEAVEQYRAALRINPNDFQARTNLDSCLTQQDKQAQ